MASTSCCCCYNSGDKLLWEYFRTKDGCCFRIDNQVMMRRWLWMKRFAQLWSMGCHQLVVGDWELIGLRCCSPILKISRFGCFGVHYFLLLEKLLNCWCKCNYFVVLQEVLLFPAMKPQDEPSLSSKGNSLELSQIF